MENPTPGAGVRIAVDGRYLSLPGMGIHGYALGVIGILLDLGADVVILSNVEPRVPLDTRAQVEIFGSPRNIVWDQIDLPRHFAANQYHAYWAPANNGIPLLGPRPPRTIITIHDLIPLLQPISHIVKRPLYGLPWIAAVAAGALRADVVTTVSHFSAERIHTWLRRRAVVLPPSSVRMPAPEATPAPSHPELRGRYALYNGGFGSRKRVDTLLRAMAVLPPEFECQLVCLGKHMDHYAPLIDELGIADRIVSPGYVSDSERDAWVQHAFALAYPSTMEGFGMPLLEAMNKGVPVITSRNSSLAEVGDDAAMFADPALPVEWAAALVTLDDETVHTRCRDLGLARAEHYRSTDLDALVAEAVGLPDRVPAGGR